MQESREQGKRILLVEDEEGVRRLAATILRRNGYVVFDAGDAQEALQTFEREGGDLDLVVSDVVMPGKTGLELAEELLSRRSELPVLLNSGNTCDSSQLPDIYKSRIRFLAKPYDADALLRAVKAAIELESEQ